MAIPPRAVTRRGRQPQRTRLQTQTQIRTQPQPQPPAASLVQQPPQSPSDERPQPPDLPPDEQNLSDAEMVEIPTKRKARLMSLMDTEARKRPKKCLMTELIAPVKIFPRVVSPFLPILTAVDHGLVKDQIWASNEMDIIDAEDEAMSEEVKDAEEEYEELLDEAYSVVLSAMPKFRDIITDFGDDIVYSNDFIKQMKLACQSARQNDTKDLKKMIPTFFRYNYAKGVECFDQPTEIEVDIEVPEDSRQRGFHCWSTARMLTPHRLIDQFNEGFRAGAAKGKIAITASDFPFFMYNSDGVLGRGPLLFMGFEEMFMGSWRGFLLGEKRKTPIAQLIKLKNVTPRLIAYTACQVRFCLSSMNAWGPADGAFSYYKFFALVVDAFKYAEDEEQVKETLAIWNKKYMSTVLHGGEVVDPTDVDPDPESDEMRIIAAKRAKRAELRLQQENPMGTGSGDGSGDGA